MTPEKFVVARHLTEGKLLLAVCDSTMHGKKFEDEQAVLDLGSKFYSGEEKNEEQTAELMAKAYMINTVGKEAVALVVKLGLAENENVKSISGVPHVQVLMV